MNGVPPIHLINLDRSTERLRIFREWNSHLENVVRVPAVDGDTLDREALIRAGYITDDLPYPAGTLGCAVSHVKLWEMAVSQNQSVTIFEDDVVVSRQFYRRAREVLSVVPEDWDIILWGYTFSPLFVWVDFGVSKARLHPYGAKNYTDEIGLQRFQTEDNYSIPMRLLHSFGMLGYSLSTKGARVALEYCLPLRNRLIKFPDAGVTTPDEGIDCALCGLYPMLKAFICVPQLLIHRDEGDSARLAIDRGREVVTP